MGKEIEIIKNFCVIIRLEARVRQAIAEYHKNSEKKKRQNFLGENNIAKRPEVRAKLSKHATEHNSFCLPEVREKLSKNHRMKNEEQVKIQSEKLKEFYKTEKGMLLREQQETEDWGKYLR